MRFLADMGISQRVVQALRDQDHNAVHLTEEGLQELTDSVIVEKARGEGRVILTHDLDFSRLLALSNDSSPSAITFRLSDMRRENVLAHLHSVVEKFTEELEQGAIVSIGDHTSRCRMLPIHSSE